MFKQYVRPNWLTISGNLRDSAISAAASAGADYMRLLFVELKTVIEANDAQHRARLVAFNTLCQYAEQAYGPHDAFLKRLEKVKPERPPALEEMWKRFVTKVASRCSMHNKSIRQAEVSQHLRLVAKHGTKDNDYWWQYDPEHKPAQAQEVEPVAA